jgi:uncharacterized phiE125 gp8 family phage protein
MLSHDALGLDGCMLDEAKAFLRLETEDEDPALAAMMLAAIGHAEAVTGVTFIARTVRQTVSASTGWKRLTAHPVRAINAVMGLPADGPAFALQPAQYIGDIDACDDGYIRVLVPGSAGRVEVSYTAGVANDWASLPETLRAAILRLTAHFYAHRDAPDDAGPPPAVAALLAPWRRMQLMQRARA